MKKILQVLIFAILFANNLQAQNNSIFGFVLDNSTTQTPVAGAWVYVTGNMHDSTNSTYILVNDSIVTDSTGAFNFTINQFTIDIDTALLVVNTPNCISSFESANVDLLSSTQIPILFYNCENTLPTCSLNVQWALDSVIPNNIIFTSQEFASGNNWSIEFGDGTSVGIMATNHVYSANYLQNGVIVNITDTFANGCIATQQLFIQIDINSSCSANFTYNSITSIPPSQTYDFQFTNLSTGSGLNYSWNFGDSAVSSNQNPIHNYQSPGTYQVCLSITANNGCTSNLCNFINIIDTTQVSCSSNFNIMPAPGGIGQYIFDGTQNVDTMSAGTYSGNWDFGDSTYATNTLTPTHTYTSAGFYNVCFTTISSNGCISTTCSNIYVNYPLSCGIKLISQIDSMNSNDVLFYSVDTIGINPNWNMTYTIDYGDGSIDSGSTVQGVNLGGIMHTYDSAGVYNVCLQATNSFGCVSSYCDSINIVLPTTYNCAHTINISSNDTIAYFSSTGNGNIVLWQWTFGDNTANVTTPVNNTQHIYGSYANYNACLTVTAANGCTSSSCGIVNIQEQNGIHGIISIDSLALDSTVSPRYAKVFLLSYTSDSINEVDLQVVDSLQLNSFYNISNYQFYHLPHGKYTVYAQIYYSNGNIDTLTAPLYSGNKLHWFDADTLNLTHNFIISDIIFGAPNNVTGAGAISGAISDGPNRSNVGLSGVNILLLNANNQILKNALTNNNGIYRFGNLPMGTYHIYPEVAGKETEQATVTLSSSNLNATNINFELGATIYPTTGIVDLSSDSDVRVYPNPSNAIINIQFKDVLKMSVMKIYNSAGILVLEKQNINSSQTIINVESFSKGIYFIEFVISSEMVKRVKFIKD